MPTRGPTRGPTRELSEGAGRSAMLFLGLVAVLGLCLAVDFLLFHTLAELFAVSVGLSLFFIAAWQPPSDGTPALGYVGAGYFWVALIDLMHTVTYEGMNIHPHGGADVATQFWLAGRCLEALLLVSLPLLLTRPPPSNAAFVLFGTIAGAFYITILDETFPTAYVAGEGLTAFKVMCEYTVIGVLGIAAGLLWRRREALEPCVARMMMGSIACTMVAELLFTSYVGVYDPVNALGHVLKFGSYWLILMALLRRQPEPVTEF